LTVLTARRQRRRPRIPVVRAVGLLIVAAVIVVIAVEVLGGSTVPPRGPLESMFQDDALLVYGTNGVVEKTLATLKGLGVDRLRITVKWSDIAPDPTSRTRPRGFRAADPSAYSELGFARYDRIDLLAARQGIAVDFDVTAPAPLWATTRGVPARYAANAAPRARDFRAFVTALGRRYDGRYAITIPGVGRMTLPRVSFWSVWNEPNQPGWLAPQYRRAGRGTEMEAPRLYRAYADAAYTALHATGHAGDRILVGELAPEGCAGAGAGTCFYAPTLEPIAPIPFVESLYCVDAAYRPLRGAAASAVGCPPSGSRRAFVAANPVLFDATGFAHHPYSFFLAPNVPLAQTGFVPLANLGRLERGLDRAFAAYGLTRRIPLYLDEYGYVTNPPNPVRGKTLAQQASYLDEAAYMAWKDPRVEGLSQFLLVDAAPDTSFAPGSAGYWSTFQTGLEFVSGKPKPSLRAYRVPIWLPSPSVSPGAQVPVWAMLRAATNGTLQRASIQWRRGPGSAWRTLGHVSTRQPDGVFETRVTVPASGRLRVQWRSPGGASYDSRGARIRVRAS
jgi:hypothetical protein